MNKTRFGALLGALLIIGALFAVPLAGSAFAVTEHCPDGGTKDESGADDNDFVPAAGTEICVKSSNEATGIIVADGTSTLQEYLEAAGILDGSGEQGSDVSHWVIYETTTTTTTEETTEETTTEETTTEETTTEETTTEETTSEETTSEETTSSETTSKTTTPSGSVEELTPPQTDTIGQSGGSSSVSTGLLLVLAGILAAVLVVVPAAARNRR